MTDTPDTITREEADARVAAALIEAAEAPGIGMDKVLAILALIPEAGGALDRAIAEAEARGMERAADLHDETFCDKRAKKAYWQSDLIRAEAAAIRARTEGEG